VLHLQRTIGNHATTKRLPMVKRKFVDDLEGLNVNAAIELLKQRYPNATISVLQVTKLLQSNNKYDLNGLASALNLVPGNASTPTTTPQSGDTLISQKSIRMHQPVTSSLKSQGEVTIALPKPKATLSPIKSKSISPKLPGKNEGKEEQETSDSKLELESVILEQPQSAVGTRTVFNKEELREKIKELYQRKPSPQKADFMNLFKSLYHPDHILTIVQTPEFAYGFQDSVREQVSLNSENEEFLEKTKINNLAEDDSEYATKYKMGDISTWTLRHYSDKGTDSEPPPFTSILSTAGIALLVPDDKKKSGHTGDRDWNRYGNTGNTFFILCVGNQLYGKQEFLKNTKWYVEFPFDQPSLWLSSDWLDEKDIKGPVLRGRGKDVHRNLLKAVGNVTGTFFENSLVGLFHNLEVKVPGTLTFNKSDWKKK